MIQTPIYKDGVSVGQGSRGAGTRYHTGSGVMDRVDSDKNHTGYRNEVVGLVDDHDIGQLSDAVEPLWKIALSVQVDVAEDGRIA